MTVIFREDTPGVYRLLNIVRSRLKRRLSYTFGAQTISKIRPGLWVALDSSTEAPTHHEHATQAVGHLIRACRLAPEKASVTWRVEDQDGNLVAYGSGYVAPSGAF